METIDIKGLKEIDPNFHLYYVDKNGDQKEVKDASRNFESIIPKAINNSKSKKEIEFVFIVHGFQNDITAEWMHRLKDAIVNKGTKYFVCIVGWGNGSKTLSYPSAAANTQLVGAWLSTYINYINKINNSLSRIRCIGHSLGAHLIGSAGVNTKIDRIDALDPAGPLFANPPLGDVSDGRLSLERARFVQVIHTDGFRDVDFPLGTLVPMGHVDFYVNYGGDQIGTLHVDAMHSHSMAYEFYIRSVESDTIYNTTSVLTNTPSPGFPCKTVKKANDSAQMGFWCRTSSRGLYHVDPENNLNAMGPGSAETLKQINPKFHVYHSSDGTGTEVKDAHSNFMINVDDAIQNSEIETEETFECVFIVPGFMAGTYTDWMRRLREAILNKTKSAIVIIVEWGDMKEYTVAAANTKIVGPWLGGYVSQLRRKFKDRVFIRCIGHGLGAHLIGFASSGKNIDRIDALDPSGPLFESGERRLCSADAKFVQVIHTDGFCALPATPRGTMLPMGHVDFYVNFAKSQPGNLIRDPDHSHAMAHEYYIKSFDYQAELISGYAMASKATPGLDPEEMVVKRETSAYMGWGCEPSSTGNYYLRADIKDLEPIKETVLDSIGKGIASIFSW